MNKKEINSIIAMQYCTTKINKMKTKIEELKELRKIPKKQLTDEQKARIKELLKELSKVILRWILDLLTLGTAKLIKK